MSLPYSTCHPLALVGRYPVAKGPLFIFWPRDDVGPAVISLLINEPPLVGGGNLPLGGEGWLLTDAEAPN